MAVIELCMHTPGGLAWGPSVVVASSHTQVALNPGMKRFGSSDRSARPGGLSPDPGPDVDGGWVVGGELVAGGDVVAGTVVVGEAVAGWVGDVVSADVAGGEVVPLVVSGELVRGGSVLDGGAGDGDCDAGSSASPDVHADAASTRATATAVAVGRVRVRDGRRIEGLSVVGGQVPGRSESVMPRTTRRRVARR
jgi:hypothetical protein